MRKYSGGTIIDQAITGGTDELTPNTALAQGIGGISGIAKNIWRKHGCVGWCTAKIPGL